MTKILSPEEKQFLTDLELCSHLLAIWARSQFQRGRSLQEIKSSLRSAADACGRA
jgi:hypothetical protein